MRYRLTTPARRDAARQAKADRERASGLPDRAPDCREPLELDLRNLGGPWWRAEPRVGRLGYRVVDARTNAVVMYAPPKTILRVAAAQLPRQLGARNFA